jgi:hypothetical protein
MSNVIEFLERMGQDAELRYANGQAMEVAMTAADIDPAVRAALAAGDQQQLAALLGAKNNVCCAVFPVDPESACNTEVSAAPRQLLANL